MTKASTNTLLQAAAKTLAWELYALAGYGRTRAYVNVERFERELLSSARMWRRTHDNLKKQRRTNGRTEP